MKLNPGTSNEFTLIVVLESEGHGREFFDHHETLDEMLDTIKQVINTAILDPCERLVGIAVVPVSEYGSDDGYGFGLEQWPPAFG
ncbi:hypothetical protein Pan258_29250 [Symmachiella dynata]|uniref:hypothetical protein n=1 Tax=Symmachiella dynata TaxID=2527995 RepID=UPI001189458D|nr:hypothetical protein [Symmachiella dynata]QDT48878.1 hypothetical protein Pan258_29250 [Symmachiella dynata]